MNMEEVSSRRERELIAAAGSGDREAFSELLRRNETMVYGAVLGYCGDTHAAQEALQQAFCRAWQRLRSFRGDSSFGTWLCRIALNAASDLSRRRDRRREAGDEALALIPDRGRSPREKAAAGELERIVADAVASLPERYRSAAALHYLAGASLEQAAAVLGLRPAGVATRLKRARRMLRRRLAWLQEELYG